MPNIVVIPTYNEAQNIAIVIHRILQLDCDLHVLIVDDNSPDHTADIVATMADASDRVHLYRRSGLKGYGPSCVDGYRYALEHGYDVVISMDADLSHDPADLPRLVDGLLDSDVAIGSRYLNGNVSVVNWPLSRLFLSTFAGKYVRAVTGLKIADPTSGFRAFRAEVLKHICLDTLHSNGYCFIVETIHRAKICGYKITEIPIIFTERRAGQSKMNNKIIREAVIMPWRLRFWTNRSSKKTELR